MPVQGVTLKQLATLQKKQKKTTRTIYYTKLTHTIQNDNHFYNI